MNYVFFGTPEFAAIVLRKLIEAKIPPSLVITNPDRPFGRKKIITPPPVKQLIANCQLPIEVLQPEDLKTISPRLSALEAEFFILAAYAKILPKEILQIPRLHVIGVHPSLLPKYRGPTPIQNAILNGEKETGVTLYLLDEKVDHGEIIAAASYKLDGNETYEKLMRKLAELGADLLLETIPEFIAGRLTPEKQDEAVTTYTKKFTSQDGFVKPEILEAALAGENREQAKLIERKIRALNPEPGVWTYAIALANPEAEKREKRVKLLEAELREDKLILKKIQIEGRKPICPSL
ncbi:MAG: methionyl-tRNA formyltransferase [Candidatus Liptonbacteria bacterium]|nr:methionyl-tRNA formyltransferase [Candidatus Liptonbacteria bacterium]